MDADLMRLTDDGNPNHPPEAKPLVIYHGGGCFDGFCCAWLFSKAFPDPEFLAAKHGDLIPDVRGRDVYIADFSYKRSAMLVIAQSARSLTVLDHHKTAATELDGFADECRQRYGTSPTIVFDMDRSGGRLAWDYLQQRSAAAVQLDQGYCRSIPDGVFTELGEGGGLEYIETPWLVQYTEDRDLWRWSLPDSREVNAALRSLPMTFETWDVLDERRSAMDLVPEGRAILRREAQIVEQHVRHAKPITIAGHTVPAVNATVLFSEIAGELAKGQPFAATYFDRNDGLRQWSLRSDDNGLDVSEIARQFGGGGHARAAGYTERLDASGQHPAA